MKRIIFVAAALGFGIQAQAADQEAVVDHYADLAHAVYSDSLAAARVLDAAV
ncbi:MAG: peptidase, partial [Proteobacteria bacterium]